MAKGKYAGKKSLNVKPIAMLLAIGLLVGSAIGGTLAWLTDDTDPVTNTFTVGNIEIDLDESDDLDLKMVPGKTLLKDPVVTVKGGSESSWVFVKLEKTNNPDKYLDYAVRMNGTNANVEDGYWKELDATNHPGVYYCQVKAVKADLELPVLACKDSTHKNCEGCVKVREDVTKDDMDALLVKENGEFKLDDKGNFVYDENKVPTLSFTAYAIQKANFDTAIAAWAEVSK